MTHSIRHRTLASRSMFRSRPLSAFVALLAASGCARSAGSVSADAAPSTAMAAISRNLDPSTPLTAMQRRWVDSTLASLSLRDRIGQMTHVWVLGDYTNDEDSTYAEVRRWVERDHIGGMTMSLGTPIEVAAKINALQKRSRIPLIVASDLEPGLGRLEGGLFSHYLLDAGSATVFPSNMAIAATGRDQDAFDVARIIAREARAVGIQINFAPTVDVNNNPSNPVINTRSFGEDPQRVARLAAAFVRGTQSEGVLATAKHFPGHGDTDVDSHVGLPIVGASRARLDTVELVPFRAAIAAGAGLVMTAHIALPAIEGDSTPATLAPRIITGLLRDSLHFRGLTITDAMSMEGVGQGYSVERSSVLAVQAGADVLLKPTDPTKAIDAVLAAVERGDIGRERIEAAARRALELKARTGVAFHRYVSLDTLRAVVGAPAHRAAAFDIAQRAVTLLRDEPALLPIAGSRIAIIQYAPETELRAGRILPAEVRLVHPRAQSFRVGPSTSPATLDSIGAAVRGSDRVIVAAYVRRIEGSGRVAVPRHIASWIDSLATAERVVVIAHGNPYLIRQFPRVRSYLVTYGVGDALERASALAVLGRSPITGTAPISLPGFFRRGDGLRRDAAAPGTR